MLALAEVHRYARQLLVADVGRAGQETFLAAALTAEGSSPALDVAAELLTAAGVTVKRGRPEAPPTIADRRLGASAFADLRAGCAQCVERFLAEQPAAAAGEGPAVSFALGSALAAEVLLALLEPRRPPLALAFVPEPHRALAICACAR